MVSVLCATHTQLLCHSTAQQTAEQLQLSQYFCCCCCSHLHYNAKERRRSAYSQLLLLGQPIGWYDALPDYATCHCQGRWHVHMSVIASAYSNTVIN